MLLKCICTNCSGHLEFEEENAGEQIKCPHCGWDTTLVDSATQAEAQEEPNPGVLRRHARKLYLAAAVAALLGLLIFSAQRWLLPRLEEMVPFAEGPLMLWLTLLGGLWFLLFLAIWTAFPVLLLFQVRRLTSILGQLELNSRPAPPPEVQPDQEPETVQEQ